LEERGQIIMRKKEKRVNGVSILLLYYLMCDVRALSSRR